MVIEVDNLTVALRLLTIERNKFDYIEEQLLKKTMTILSKRNWWNVLNQQFVYKIENVLQIRSITYVLRSTRQPYIWSIIRNTIHCDRYPISFVSLNLFRNDPEYLLSFCCWLIVAEADQMGSNERNSHPGIVDWYRQLGTGPPTLYCVFKNLHLDKIIMWSEKIDIRYASVDVCEMRPQQMRCAIENSQNNEILKRIARWVC